MIVDICCPATFVLYGAPLGGQNVRDLLLGDGGEYWFGSSDVSWEGRPRAEVEKMFQVATERLRTTGWEVKAPPDGTPSTETTLAARRGADIVELDLMVQPGAGNAYLSVAVTRATPWAVYPAGVAGGLIGAVVGWFVFGWASRRTEARAVAVRAIAGSCYGLAMFLWITPMLVATASLLKDHQDGQSFRSNPLWKWLGQPDASLPFLVGAGLTLVALAVAALPRRARDNFTGPIPA